MEYTVLPVTINEVSWSYPASDHTFLTHCVTAALRRGEAFGVINCLGIANAVLTVCHKSGEVLAEDADIEHLGTLEECVRFVDHEHALANMEAETEYSDALALEHNALVRLIRKYGRDTIPRIVNLTPHDITVIVRSRTMTIPSEGQEHAARVSVKRSPAGQIVLAHDFSQGESQDQYDEWAVPLTRPQFGDVYNLPTPLPGHWFVVSRIVADAAKGRKDLLVPDELVRDDNDVILGCTSFSRN